MLNYISNVKFAHSPSSFGTIISDNLKEETQVKMNEYKETGRKIKINKTKLR